MSLAKRVLPLFIPFLLCTACDSGARSSRQVAAWDLTPSDHETVLELVRKIYESGLGDSIAAWYESTSRGYFDPAGGGVVEFEGPINTLSVAVPESITMTGDVRSELDRLASTTSHRGWRLVEYRVAIEPGGGGPSVRFSKVTLYPIRVEAPHDVSPSTAAKPPESGQGSDQPAQPEGAEPKLSPCEILKKNVKETGSKYDGLQKTLQEVDGADLMGCSM